MHLAPDQDNYNKWYINLVDSFNKKATKVATTEVEKKWWQWKADQIDRHAAEQAAKMDAAVCNRNVKYFLDSAALLELQHNSQCSIESACSTPIMGRKCTISGSTPKANLSGLWLHAYKFTYRLRLTISITIALPQVMCPCVT
jgi:hypothetical protein